jgi:xanthosine utilization system XapX-like protein
MKRILRIFSGIALLLIGFVLSLPFVPGPGIPLMILGLVILGEHFPWARRIVDWGKAKLEGLRSRNTPPPAAG